VSQEKGTGFNDGEFLLFPQSVDIIDSITETGHLRWRCRA
jgi:hypothetical protein